MDPRANIDEQVALARDIVSDDFDEAAPGGRSDAMRDLLARVDRLAELVLALDEWRRKGGFYGDTSDGRKEFAQEIEGLLWPELFPPGHPRHDPGHVYWQGEHEHEEAFQWSADTIEWVADAVQSEVKS